LHLVSVDGIRCFLVFPSQIYFFTSLSQNPLFCENSGFCHQSDSPGGCLFVCENGSFYVRDQSSSEMTDTGHPSRASVAVSTSSALTSLYASAIPSSPIRNTSGHTETQRPQLIQPDLSTIAFKSFSSFQLSSTLLYNYRIPRPALFNMENLLFAVPIWLKSEILRNDML